MPGFVAIRQGTGGSATIRSFSLGQGIATWPRRTPVRVENRRQGRCEAGGFQRLLGGRFRQYAIHALDLSEPRRRHGWRRAARRRWLGSRRPGSTANFLITPAGSRAFLGNRGQAARQLSRPLGPWAKQPLATWSGRGLTRIDGASLSGAGAYGLLLPAGPHGPCLSCFAQFRRLLFL